MKTFDEALHYLLAQVKQTENTETISIFDALGRVLAEPIVSPLNVPPHDNSMMDGYALHSYDLEHNSVFEVSQRIPAGTSPMPLKPGTAARIFTGAPIPEGANMVVMQEETEQLADNEIRITASHSSAGQNIRVVGEDIQQNTTILKAGHKLRPQDLGLITSIGFNQVTVFKPLTIATFTTGDELLEPGEVSQPGKIYNANRYVLAGLVPQLGFKLIDLGRVDDTIDATVEAMKKAASMADVVITTGGVSVGEEDHIKPAIEQLGSLDMWKVKMKPGKPIAYGDIQGTPFIGLPGNPVSAFATFNLFARPYLLKMQGANVLKAKPIWLEADFEWLKPGFRREFARARLVNKNQISVVEIYPNQGSGVLTSTVWADGFVVIPEDNQINRGDKVAFYPFNPVDE
ncbi:molybdopterin molybdenumtransferase MoeA [Thiomicrorhabdus immobilis]|uniref:Molybdopterin molybdenumtransferase n=1 Tax=Thiomicrorhabdus immobilis TaxID=2791037 RepID=A0ABN6CV20_9GAMM|nr:gephyrin-like molybdotransferase Glp [Thiomicrorhabdus immobilis]BCN92369.1 molybdopterin molybdenumtransferase MoeA [Thiomicrorhabdus immobilis]